MHCNPDYQDLGEPRGNTAGEPLENLWSSVQGSWLAQKQKN